MGNCYEDTRSIDENLKRQIIINNQPQSLVPTIIAELKSLPAISPHIQSRIKELGPFGSNIPKTIYQLKNKSVYQGEFKNKLFNGPAKLILADGTIIQSHFQQGVPKNKTRIFKPNGDYFSGDIQASGKENAQIFQKGVLYNGEILNSKPHGNGFEKTRHYTFLGSYENGKKTNGKLQWNIQNPKFTQIYQGPFRDNLFHGLGTLKNSEGVFKGNFDGGVKTGYGELTYSDGTVFKGNFANGKQNGQGKIYNYKGDIIQEGQWLNGKKLINQR